MTAPRPALSVVCPMYNEAAGIERAIDALVAALDGLGQPWELILVDDGSTDDCAALARRRLSEVAGGRVIGHSPNRGRGYALRQGFAAARAPIVVATESDLSWGADVVPRLYRAVADGPHDLVVASPYLPGGALVGVPAHRAALSRVGNRMLRRVLPVSMATGMTRGYRREVLESLELTADDKDVHLQILAQALDRGFRVGELPAVLRWEDAPRRSTLSSAHLASHLRFLLRRAGGRSRTARPS